MDTKSNAKITLVNRFDNYISNDVYLDVYGLRHLRPTGLDKRLRIMKTPKKQRITPALFILVTGKGELHRSVLKNATLEEAKDIGRRLVKLCKSPVYIEIQDETLKVLFDKKF